MSLALNVRNWWECSVDDLWAMSLSLPKTMNNIAMVGTKHYRPVCFKKTCGKYAYIITYYEGITEEGFF